MAEKHEFALYVPRIQECIKDNILIIVDKNLVQRISQIVRLQPNDICLLFDATLSVRAVLKQLSKKQAEFTIASRELIKPLTPSITMMIPLLKREALEAALYSCVELGANSIQLLITEKVQRSWGGQKEYDRLQRIMIAAAEQSKNFAIPHLREPIHFKEVITSAEGTGILFDPEGAFLPQVMQQLEHIKPNNLTLVVGPEGALTADEITLLKKHEFIFCRLTPTILRAHQAVTLGLGVMRSFF